MIKRYENAAIAAIFSDENKVALWLKTELAALKARAVFSEIGFDDYDRVETILMTHQVDIARWLELEKSLHHDLGAFLKERIDLIPPELQQWWHREMTSYDTEEPAFARMLMDAVKVVLEEIERLEKTIIVLARRYRYTPMMGDTHGQWAEVQTFGKRCLTWLKVIRVSRDQLVHAAENLRYSKMSGAVGNYTGVSAEF